ncbi:MAG: AAA family ATPase [Candidatus Aenigmatarchaeota archaeon]
MGNYRPFYGKETILFSLNPKKPFTIIYAGTGSGKTTILDAIAWCLYGKEIHKPQPLDTMLNDDKRDELKKNDMVNVSVEIIMGESETKIDYIFTRSISFYKNKEGRVEVIPNTEKFSAKVKDARNNLIDAAEADVPARRVFPEDIQHLFMFDGEKLQHFFEIDNMRKTRQAILDITNMNLIESAIKHLKDISKDYKGDEEENPQLEKLNAFIDSVEKQIERNIIEIKENEDNLKNATIKLNSVMESLNKAAGADKDLRKLINEEQKIRGLLEENNNALETLEKRRFDHLLSSLPYLFCKKQLLEAREIIDKTYESGEPPITIRTEFFNLLLNKRKKCICGTDLKPGSAARKNVETYKNKTPLSDYEEEIRHGQAEMLSLLRENSKFLEERKSSNEEENKLKQSIKDWNNQLGLITKDIKGLKKEEIESLYSQKDFQIGEIERCSQRIGDLRGEITRYDKDKRRWEEEKRALEKQLIKNTEMKEKFGICDSGIEFLETIREELITEVKNEIEKRTDDVFKQSLIEPRVERICITDDFECQVLDKYNKSIYASLSSGQKQILSTSFMIALRKESGFDSPILIDYPFGRIDVDVTAELINGLKKVLEGVQVNFFLIEGKELTDLVWQQMKSYTGVLYQIKKIKDKRRSEVIKHEKY